MRKLILLSVLLLVACNKHADYQTFTGFQQGTTYSIIVGNPPEDCAAKIDNLFSEIDLTFSIFNPASLVSRINRNETDVTTPIFESCFSIAKDVHRDTEGFYDPTVKPLVDAWGFGPGEEQQKPNVDSLMQLVGFDKIEIRNHKISKADPRVSLDFSSIAKGFTVDRLAEMLAESGCEDFMVEVGGEVRARGCSPRGTAWRIQIDKPSGGFAHERQALVELSDGAIATSGNYRNWFVDAEGNTRVHTIDPHTGFPAAGEVLSASVVSGSCALSDGWATALVACRDVERARQLLETSPQLEYYIVSNLGSFHSEGFPVSD